MPYPRAGLCGSADPLETHRGLAAPLGPGGAAHELLRLGHPSCLENCYFANGRFASAAARSIRPTLAS
jgi:hypothetical protein